MVLKRKSMYGLEIELFTLDSEGKLVNGAPDILRALEGARLGRYVRKELSKCMIELGAKEKKGVKECALTFLDNLAALTETAERTGHRLLPLGAHPGSVLPELQRSDWYDAKKSVLGEDAFREGRICGFHFHYTLPEGIVERRTQRIRKVGRSKAKDVFLQQYNFLVAADPAVITFCQSTPFWMGFHWAKDCRVLVYRDMKVVKGGEALIGMHRHLPMLGALPAYEFTLEDLRVMADRRKSDWLALLEQKRFPTNKIATYPTLKFMWGPLRVNKVGTFEYRGPDMNQPEVIFSVSRLLVYALRAIEEGQLKAIPSDIGSEEPFSIEDEVIHLPPHATLKHLEQQSVLNGFSSLSVSRYCSRLFRLIDRLSRKGRRMTPLRKMIEEKRTVADRMLEMVRKNGYNTEEEVPADMLDHLALYHADRLPKEIDRAREALGHD